MKLAPHPRYRAIADVLRKHRNAALPWTGMAFRAAMLPFARADKLVDGKGAYLHGSHWCAPRAFRCVNLSTTAKTALQESHSLAAYYGWDEAVMNPRVIVGVNLKLHHVLDLVAYSTLAQQLALADMLAEAWRELNTAGDESFGQALGRAAHALDAEAIVVPSAQVKGGVNIVVFPEALQERSKIHVVGEDELNRWLKKK